MTRITELTPLLKRLQLGPMAATLPERIALARREQLDYASFLEIILSDEVNRRAQRRIELRLNVAGFEETCCLEDFDWSASITLDRRLLDAVFSLRRRTKEGGEPIMTMKKTIRRNCPTRPAGGKRPGVGGDVRPVTASLAGWTGPWTLGSAW